MPAPEFEARGLPWNVSFGRGAIGRLAPLLKQFGYARPLLLGTPGRARQMARVTSVLTAPPAGVFNDAAAHVPAACVEAAAAAARAANADCTISVGGGSATGLGKALRLLHDLPQIAVPTTYAGSEMTNIWGITEGSSKRTGRDDRVLPVAAVYDPDLLGSLPLHVAGPSVLNAMAQAIANLTATRGNPLAALLAREAATLLAAGLEQLIAQADDDDARGTLLYGACLAGAALGIGQSGLHHRICHVLGGKYNLPHAETHAVILPYSVAYNATAAAAETAAVAAALGTDNAPRRLHGWMRQVSRRHSLRDLGVPATELEAASRAICATPIANPEAVTVEAVRSLLQRAWEGKAP